MTTKEEHDAKYPMCTKLSSVKDESQSIGRFLDWLQEREEPITLCLHSYHRGRGEDEYFPARIPFQKLLAEYFEIDENKLEEERRTMLEELQEKANAQTPVP